MKRRVVREWREQESDLARAWWELQPDTLLALADRRRWLLLYNGQPGGPAGPDVRDAVLRPLPPLPRSPTQQEQDAPDQETELVGDVEFHLRSSDWFAHGHQDDPRYNRVVLHVVHYLDSAAPTRRQDGCIVPDCSLLDLPRQRLPMLEPAWPCQRQPLAPQAITSTLLTAGLRRFHEKREALSRALDETQAPPGLSWSNEDLCLLTALAEGLGYGRDRAFFRAAGLHLLGLPAPLTEPLGRAPEPAPLDARRLRALHTLITRWQAPGAWQTLRLVLETNTNVKTTIAALRTAFFPLSQARSDILITNVLLPFAVAIAARENALSLSIRAQHIYLAYPTLPSNHITRAMTAQLLLPGEPQQACLQQGLHDVYNRACRAKDCQHCICHQQQEPVAPYK